MPADQHVDVAAVRSAHPIAEVVAASGVELNARGHGYMGCCPFHDDRTASMSVDGTPERFHCFGCGASGDVIDYVQRLEGLSFTQAVRRLETAAGLTIEPTNSTPSRRREPRADRAWSTTRRRVHEVNDMAWAYFTGDPALIRAETYLREERSIDVSALRRDMGGGPVVGYAAQNWHGLIDHLTRAGVSEAELLDADLAQRTRDGRLIDTYRGRLVVPVRGAEHRIDGFLGRLMTGSAQAPKYRNPTRTPAFDKQTAVYRPAHQQLRPDATTVIVEGALDALVIAAAAAVAGQSARFAPCTSSGVTVSGEQASRVLGIHPRPLVIALDGDTAGAQGTLRWLAQVSLQRRRPALVTSLPAGCDPAEWLAAHGPAGLAAFDRACTLLAHGREPLPQLPGRQLAQLAARSDDPVRALVEAVAPLLPQLPTPAARRLIASAESELGAIIGPTDRFRTALCSALQDRGSPPQRWRLPEASPQPDQRVPARRPFSPGPQPP